MPSAEKKNLISFIIPCYASEGSVGLVIDEIRQVVAQKPDFDYQIVAVNDCSPDKVLDVLTGIAALDPKVGVIDLAKNGGRHNALICGCHYAAGDYVVFIDDDQQCPADRLWDLLDPLVNGNYDVAIARYRKKTQSRFKNFGSAVNDRVATWLLGMAAQATGIYVPDPALKCFSTYPSFTMNDMAGVFREFGQTLGALFSPEAWVHTVKQGDAAVVVGSGWALVRGFDFLVVMSAFFFVDLFDTLGTLIGVSMKGGFLTKEGKLPRISGALCADAIATSVGAVLGTSTTTTYVESASGVMAGGKTGLTAVTSAALFALAILFAPIFLAIPAFATAPALIIVGYMMLSSCADIDWRDAGEAVPAFLAIAAMPFTYSISDGIMFGVISYTVINALAGNFRRIHWIMYILTALFVAKYALM